MKWKRLASKGNLAKLALTCVVTTVFTANLAKFKGSQEVSSPVSPDPTVSKQKFTIPEEFYVKKDNLKPSDELLQPVVQGTVDLLDGFIKQSGSDKTVENYNLVKSMLALWNPEASKWAREASARYKKLVNLRQKFGKDEFGQKPEEKLQEITTEVEQCGCNRKIVTSFRGNEEELARISANSTCSRHSAARGDGQRVIGFSFYGNPNSKLGKERKYFQGIKDNLALLPKFYPGWNMRLYYDLPIDHPIMTELCELACNDPNLDLCYVRRIPTAGDISKVFAMIWRFFPIIDPQVSHFASRDLDSRLNARESAAVSAWLSSSTKSFHFMRDHPAHGIEILGSGWGVRLGPAERPMAEEAFEVAAKDKLFWANRKAYGPDQGFLKRYIWPWAKWNALSHDSYTCAQFPRTSAFPTQREIGPNNFIAAVVEANDVMREECPIKCRPKEHKDWKYC